MNVMFTFVQFMLHCLYVLYKVDAVGFVYFFVHFDADCVVVVCGLISGDAMEIKLRDLKPATDYFVK